MSGRGATEAVKAIIAGQSLKVGHLVAVELDTPIYLTDLYKPIDWRGNVYQAVGHLLGISEIAESATIEASNIQGTLSGIDQIWLSIVLQEDYLDKRLIIHKVFLDEDERVVPEPVLTFDGRLTSSSMAEDPESGSSTVMLKAANAWADFDRRSGRFTNDSDQQFHFPGDKGFEFSSEIVKEIRWGRA